jgi:hypothetical protein
MAGPKRWAFKNSAKVTRLDRADKTVKFTIGFFLSWPLGVWLGRRMQTNSGLPVIHNPRIIYDYIVVDPRLIASRQFYKGFFAATIFGGIVFASVFAGVSFGKDAWGQRPDIKPFPAMVPREYLDENYDEVFKLYGKGNAEGRVADRKRSAWYRMFFPNSADWSFKDTTLVQPNAVDSYDQRNGFFHRATNRFREHENE